MERESDALFIRVIGWAMATSRWDHDEGPSTRLRLARLLGVFALRRRANIVLVRSFVRSAVDLLQDAARLRLEARRNVELGRPDRIRSLVFSSEIDGDPLSLESPFHDLALEP